MSSRFSTTPDALLASVGVLTVALAVGCQPGGGTTSPSSRAVAPATSSTTTAPVSSASPTSSAPTSSPTSSSPGAPWQPSLPNALATSIVIAPSAASTVYAASASGIEATTNGGATWTSVSAVAASVLAVDPTSSGTVYAGTGAGIMVTNNGGTTWSNVGPTANVTAIAVDPSTPATIYAGSDQGAIFLSPDYGQSWGASSATLSSVVASLAVDPTTGTTVYAATGGTGAAGQFTPIAAAGPGGLWKSTDGGATWTDLQNGFAGVFNVVAIDPRAPATIYAGSYATPNGALGDCGLLVESTDGGATWARVSSFPSAHIYGIAIDPQASGTLYTCGLGGVLESTDGGVTWAAASSGFMPASQGGIPESWAIAIDPAAPLTLYASSVSGTEGVLKTTTGGH